MEDRVYIANLFDAYGSLLTDKQRKATDMYYFSDYSLREIGETLSVSRQGAHTAIQQSVKNLLAYEEKLNIVKNRTKKRNIILELQEKIASINIDDGERKILTDKLNELEEVI